MLGDQHLCAAHIGLQSLGDAHATIGPEIVFQQGDEHPGGCYTGIVQGVAQLHFAAVILVANLEPSCLGATQVLFRVWAR